MRQITLQNNCSYLEQGMIQTLPKTIDQTMQHNRAFTTIKEAIQDAIIRTGATPAADNLEAEAMFYSIDNSHSRFEVVSWAMLANSPIETFGLLSIHNRKIVYTPIPNVSEVDAIAYCQKLEQHLPDFILTPHNAVVIPIDDELIAPHHVETLISAISK